MIDKLKSILATVAPTVATALGGPLAGAAVKAIAETLGLPEDVNLITTTLEANPEMALKLAEIDIKKLEIYAQEMNSARERELKIASAEHAPLINKIVTPILALGTIACSFILFAILIFADVDPSSKDILIYVLGVLSAAVSQILSYYFGSSEGSKQKDQKIKELFK